MGMDVYGSAPSNEEGEYFRNSVWWWHPLWTYCEQQHNDITSKVEYAHSNDGDGLSAPFAYELGNRLLADLENGTVAEYEAMYNKHMASLEREECGYCGGTGIRTDLVGVEAGMPTKELDEAVSILVGRTHGWCNGCGGEGKKDSIDTWYRFSSENVAEFANFLIHCGGFSIC